jgi:uncharacterized protein
MILYNSVMDRGYELPTPEKIWALHLKYAHGGWTHQVVVEHSQAVAEIAQQLIEARDLDVDSDLVRVGCLLHDIGAYTFIESRGKRIKPRYVLHGFTGGGTLRYEGIPDAICRIAERHTGVGITREDLEKQGFASQIIPDGVFIPETLEEWLVLYADKFHSKVPLRFNSWEKCLESISRYGEDKTAKLRALADQFGIPDLAPLAARYGHPFGH